MTNRDADLWKKLVREGLDYNPGDTNAALPFVQMSRKYGSAWIAYLKAAWEAKDELSEEEFCRLNGQVPATFAAKLRG